MRGRNKTSGAMVKVGFTAPKEMRDIVHREWMWAEQVGANRFRLRNVPAYIYGISLNDIFVAVQRGRYLAFSRVILRAGHSTLRVYASHNVESDEFMATWVDKLDA